MCTISAPASKSQTSLEVIQQPLRSRACGYSLADRRPIMPPPVVKVTGVDAAESAGMIMHVSLWSSDQMCNLSYTVKRLAVFEYLPIQDSEQEPAQTNKPEVSSLVEDIKKDDPLTPKNMEPSLYTVEIKEGYVKSLRLMGQLATVGHILEDDQDEENLLFVFPDLGVRSAGEFRLRFDLYHMPGAAGYTRPLASVYSDPFLAYSPKDFPGIVPPTELSKKISLQGVQVRLKD